MRLKYRRLSSYWPSCTTAIKSMRSRRREIRRINSLLALVLSYPCEIKIRWAPRSIRACSSGTTSNSISVAKKAATDAASATSIVEDSGRLCSLHRCLQFAVRSRAASLSGFDSLGITTPQDFLLDFIVVRSDAYDTRSSRSSAMTVSIPFQ
jgi:hypothetical protein